jgi:deoxyribodipyrimidine photolyase-like uncharacterized protein
MALSNVLDGNTAQFVRHRAFQVAGWLMDHKAVTSLLAARKQLRTLYWIGQKHMADADLQSREIDAVLEWLQIERIQIATNFRMVYQATQTAFIATRLSEMNVDEVGKSSGGEATRGGQQPSILNQIIEVALEMSGLKILMI